MAAKLLKSFISPFVCLFLLLACLAKEKLKFFSPLFPIHLGISEEIKCDLYVRPKNRTGDDCVGSVNALSTHVSLTF